MLLFFFSVGYQTKYKEIDYSPAQVIKHVTLVFLLGI